MFIFLFCFVNETLFLYLGFTFQALYHHHHHHHHLHNVYQPSPTCIFASRHVMLPWNNASIRLFSLISNKAKCRRYLLKTNIIQEKEWKYSLEITWIRLLSLVSSKAKCRWYLNKQYTRKESAAVRRTWSSSQDVSSAL